MNKLYLKYKGRYCEYQKNWKKDHKDRPTNYCRKYRKIKRELINKEKNKSCKDCGIQYPPYVMDFDHRDPTTKKFTIGKSVGRSAKDLKEEILKCDVVCANCHRIRTHGHNSNFSNPD